MHMLKCYAVEIARNGIREKVPSTKDQKVRKDLGGRVGVILVQRSAHSWLRDTKDRHTVKAQSVAKDGGVEDTEARGRGLLSHIT